MRLTFVTALVLGVACSSATNLGTTSSGSGTTTSRHTSSGIGSIGGSTSGSSTSGASDAGDAGDAGPCEPTATDLTRCTTSADCACLEQCVNDPYAGTKLCEIPCHTQADCNDPNKPQVACIEGSCALNMCGESFIGQAPGTLGAACDVADAGDGTCQPEDTYAPGGSTQTLVGYCLPNGQLGVGAQSCVTDALGASLQCGPGLVCGYPYTTYGCAPSCSAVGQPGCAGGATCLALFPSVTTTGVCGACQPAGDTCLTDSDCCPPCVPDAGMSGYCYIQIGMMGSDAG